MELLLYGWALTLVSLLTSAIPMSSRLMIEVPVNVWCLRFINGLHLVFCLGHRFNARKDQCRPHLLQWVKLSFVIDSPSMLDEIPWPQLECLSLHLSVGRPQLVFFELSKEIHYTFCSLNIFDWLTFDTEARSKLWSMVVLLLLLKTSVDSLISSRESSREQRRFYWVPV